MLRSDPELLAAIGPRVRTSPFFDCTVRAGLTAVSTYNHMWLPMSYGDLGAEYVRLTTAVSMWDVAAQRHIEVTGPDADALTQLVTAVDVSATTTGQAIYAPMVDDSGVLINDPVLLHWPDGSWRFSIADADIRLWIDAVRLGHRLDAVVRELDTVTLAVQGPRAHDVAAALGFDWSDSLDTFQMRRAELAISDAHRSGLDVVVCRSGWSNQGGIEIFLDDPGGAEALWTAVEAAGRPFGIGPGAPNATERIENTFLSYGTDTGYDADPFELGMEEQLDIDGPRFIGQDALHRRRDSGIERHLIGCEIDGDPIDVLSHPVPFLVDGEQVGQLRAATHSPRFERNIGLALIASEHGPGSLGSAVLPGDEGERPARDRRPSVCGLPRRMRTTIDPGCPKRMVYGQCGRVTRSGGCELDERPCPFATAPVLDLGDHVDYSPRPVDIGPAVIDLCLPDDPTMLARISERFTAQQSGGVTVCDTGTPWATSRGLPDRETPACECPGRDLNPHST